MSIPPAKPWESTTNTENTNQSIAAPTPPRPSTVPFSSSSIPTSSNSYNRFYSAPSSSPYSAVSPYNHHHRYSTFGSTGYGSAGTYGTGGYGVGSGYYGSSTPGSYYSPYHHHHHHNQYRQNDQQPPLGTEYQSAFQVLEQVVQSFGGFAHLLESTLMAVHSSFMAMVGLAEHYGHLKQIFNDFFSIFSVFALLKSWIGPDGSKGKFGSGNTAISLDSFEKFGNEKTTTTMATSRKSYSRKPIVVFLLVFFGLPLVINRLVSHLKSVAEKRKSLQPPSNVSNFNIENDNQKAVQFARALYDFDAQSHHEISFRKGDLLAVQVMTDESGNKHEWWRGKLRHGTLGYFPSNYVELVNMDHLEKLQKEKNMDNISGVKEE